MHRIPYLIIFLLTCNPANAGYLKGHITDENGQAMPYVSIYTKNSMYGITSDANGSYFLELKPGTHVIVYSFIGYETEEAEIVIKGKEGVVRNIKMKPAASELNSIDVYSDQRDFAREVMKKARDRRKEYASAISNYSCITYQKIALEKEWKNKLDTTIMVSEEDKEEEKKETLQELEEYRKEKINLIESLSEFYFDPPSRYKEKILAFHDYAEVEVPYTGKGVSYSVQYGENDIAPVQFETTNPYVLLQNTDLYQFDFYQNLIFVQNISQKQLLSPLAPSAPLNYQFDYDGVVYEDTKKIYKIKVKPLFPGEALFEGIVFIEDSTYALVGADLSINTNVLLYSKDFRVIQNYKEVEKGIYLPVRREFFYTIKEGKSRIIGNIRVDHSSFKINNEYPAGFFGNEIKSYDEEAFNKDSLFWNKIRPLTLKESEIEFIHETDSLRNYYSSDEYHQKADSGFNEITIWSFLLHGVGHRNRSKGTEIYFNPLIAQMIPFGIGGYRHRLGGYFNKEFENGMLLETTGDIDYGFKNKDVKGKAGFGLTYLPKRFVRTFINFGDYYDQINNYSSVSTFFSRSNYARNKMFSVSQRMEIINGLFAEMTFEFNDQKPITDLVLEEWSDDLFDSLNTPVNFQRYTKSEIRLEVKYRIRQKYIMKKDRKIILGSKYPEINLIYRKGIPGIFNSEVNFDYVEIGIRHEVKLARLGVSAWNVQAGSFVNRKNLRLLEYKYFRGSDPFFFSHPLKSFQLMGPSLMTSTAYLRANYLHHFDGILLNKIPLINRLKLTTSGGAGTLIIPEENFAHIEFFGGVERIFRIRKQLFRIGVYAVTSDNTWEKADFTFKLGVNFYNSYTKQWDY